MAERMGRVGGGGGSGNPREPDVDRDARGDRPGGRGPTGLVSLVVSGLVLYLAWWVLWERSHPAASAARGVGHGDSAARLAAIRDLGRLGAQDPEIALPALVAGLADADAMNRAAAAEGLAVAVSGVGSAGPDPEEVRDALAALTGRLDDPEDAVRIRAAQALCTIVMSWHGSPRAFDLDAIETAMTRLADAPEEEVRSAAMLGLVALTRRDSETPPARLIAAMEDPSEAVRNAAAQSLAQFQRALIRSLPSLMAAMERARPECRPAYLTILRRVRHWEYPEEIAEEMIPALISGLGGRDRDVRCQVAATLGEFGHNARAAIPALLAVLHDPGEPGVPGPGNEGFWGMRDPAIAAAQALRRVAGDDAAARPPARAASHAEVVAALIDLLGAPTAGRRLAAIYALTSFEADDAIVGALVDASRDRDPWVRAAALQALQGRGARLGSRALETIRQALEDQTPRVREAAAYALFGFGTGIEPMVPALIRHALDDADPSVRGTCAAALGEIRPAHVTAAVVPMYLEAIERPGAADSLRQHLISALVPFGPAARDAVPAIVRALRAAEQDPRLEAATHAREPLNGGGARSPVEVDVALRRSAAGALGALAPGTRTADDAVSALIAALDDPADDVNQQVGESLIAFGPAARTSAPALLAAMRRAREQKNLLRAGRMAEALGQIDPGAPGSGEAIAFLDDVLRSEDALPRLFAERVLATFGTAATPAIPQLVAMASRPAIRAGPELPPIASALGRIAPGTPGASPALAALLKLLQSEPPPPGVEAVIDATARFGTEAKAALPRLRELAASGFPRRVVESARGAIATIEGPVGEP